jgi:hypothetical protein
MPALLNLISSFDIVHSILIWEGQPQCERCPLQGSKIEVLLLYSNSPLEILKL